MKKIKILSLLMALLLSSSLLLASCGSKKEEETESESETEPVVEEVELTKYGIADIMNASYSPELDTGVLSAVGAPLSYVGDPVSYDDGFIVTDDGSNVRVYNTATDTAVATLNYEKNKELDSGKYFNKYNYVDIISEDYFAVLTMSYTGDYDYSVWTDWGYLPTSSSYFEDFYKDEYNSGKYERVAHCTYTITVYDATGATVDTYGNTELYSLSEGMSNRIFNVWMNSASGLRDEYEGYDLYVADLYTKGSEVYRKSYVDGKAKYELVKDFGVAAMPNFGYNCGDYYFVFNDSDDLTLEAYDKNLNLAYSYAIPDNVDLKSHGFLANGTTVIQYSKQLDQYETDYDYRRGSDGKYDLVTLLVNADGVKEIEGVDYIIRYLTPSVADEYGNKPYADSVENLARVSFIGEDKTLDTSAANAKLMLISNDFEITAEVEIAEDYRYVPYAVAKGYYAVSLMSGGYGVYDIKGEKVATLTDPNVAGEYYVSDNSIYLNGVLVYDGGKEGTYVYSEDGTVYINSYGDGIETYSIFLDKENIVKLGTKVVDPTVDAKTVANRINACYIREDHIATVTYGEGDEKDKYVFYNVKGEVIASLEEKGDSNYGADFVYSGDDCCIFAENYYADGKEVTTYYKATFTK